MVWRSTKDFVILHKLGQGGFGQVNLIENNIDGQFYAVKIVNLTTIQELGDADTAMRLYNMAEAEAGVMKRLEHKNIVKVFSFFKEIKTEGECYYLVMEFCESGTLQNAISEAKGTSTRFSEVQIQSWTLQMAEAIKYIHDNNFVHRDIKPANVLLCHGRRNLKLGDFGLAKDKDQVTKITGKRTNVATWQYASPEFVMDINAYYTTKNDVWAFGAVVHELATLNFGFGTFARFNKVDKSGVKPYSWDLEHFLSHVLQQDPTKRPEMSAVMKLRFIEIVVPPPARMDGETSGDIRQKANVRVKDIDSNTRFPASVRRQKYVDVKKQYQSALDVADTPEEQAACWKNIGIVCLRILATIEKASVEPKEFENYANKAFECFFQSLSFRDIKPVAWIQDIQMRMSSIPSVIRNAMKDFKMLDRVNFLQSFMTPHNKINVKSAAVAEMHLILAENLLQIAADDTGSLQEIQSYLSDCNTALEFVRLYAVDPSVKDRCAELHEKRVDRECSVESTKIRQQAEQMFENLIGRKEVYTDHDMDFAWIVIDLLRQAIISAKGKDLKAEAIACVRAGNVYKNVLGNDKIGHEFYLQAVQLTLSLQTSNETFTDWYKEATDAVKKHQESNPEFQKAQKAEVLKELKPLIDELEQQNEAAAYLTHIYTKHPPLNNAKMAPLEKLKKALQKATQHYSPGTVAGEPLKTKVLFEEILKRINSFYSAMK